MLLIGVFTLYLTKNTQFFKVAVYRAARHLSNGAADKLQEARKPQGFRSFAVSLIRMLDGAVRRTTGGGSAAPLNGRAASVQHSLNLHLCLCCRV